MTPHLNKDHLWACDFCKHTPARRLGIIKTHEWKYHNKQGSEYPILERLAELEHCQWLQWSKNIAETENISPERLERWKKLWKPYAELTETEKDHDRNWAFWALELIKQYSIKQSKEGEPLYTAEQVDEIMKASESAKCKKKKED